MADLVTGSSLDPDGLVQGLAQDFCDHPGFMWTSSGFEVLHANWPTYPRGHGTRVALQVLAEFPPGTPLCRIDQIDSCSLFVVGRKRDKDSFNPQHLHVAVWDEDLSLCAQQRFVSGFRADEELLEVTVNLTADGAHAALINELISEDNEDLLPKVIDHLYVRNYDTAVREAALRVEVAMKDAIASKLNGQKLLDICLAEDGSLVPARLPNAHRAAIRSAFRSYFAYVRNEYAHNIPMTDLLVACHLVRRSGTLMRCIHVLKRMKDGG